MRELIVTTFLTLDGVMQAPGGPDEDRRRLRPRRLVVNYWDDPMGEVMGEILARRSTSCSGARPTTSSPGTGRTPEEAGGRPLNGRRSTSHRAAAQLDVGRSVLIEGDAAEGVAALKRQDGPEFQVHGSGDLIQTLLRHNLVDGSACGCSRS